MKHPTSDHTLARPAAACDPSDVHVEPGPVKPATSKELPTWGRLPLVPRRVVLIAILIGLWQAYISINHVDPLVVSSPTDVAEAFIEGWADGSLVASTLATMKVLVSAMVIGTIAAAILTTLAVWTKLGEDVLTIFTAMLNPLPSIAILPLAILWFGLTTEALIFVVANAVTWPIAINVSTGFRTANPTIIAVAQNIGLGRWRMVGEVLMPSALPHTIAGLKTGWAFGWRTLVAAELVFGVAGGAGGLGYYINNARYFLDIPAVFAGLVTIAVIGILVELCFNRLERQTIVRWGMKA